MPLFGKVGLLGLFIDIKVANLATFLHFLGFLTIKIGNDVVDTAIQIGAVIGWAGDDQRCARLIDENGVHLVDDGVVQV